jgi:hypothetical protein
MASGEYEMLTTVKVTIKTDEVISAVKAMTKKQRDAFLEDLIAATSPEYLKSIRDARADFKAGRVKSHEEVFGSHKIAKKKSLQS